MIPARDGDADLRQITEVPNQILCHEQVDAGTALGSVETEAGAGISVVGNFSAAVQVDGLVRLAGGDDLDAARAEERTEADAEGESGVLFVLTRREVGAQVVAAMSGIEDDEKTSGRGSSDGRGRSRSRNGTGRRRPRRAVGRRE